MRFVDRANLTKIVVRRVAPFVPRGWTAIGYRVEEGFEAVGGMARKPIQMKVKKKGCHQSPLNKKNRWACHHGDHQVSHFVGIWVHATRGQLKPLTFGEWVIRLNQVIEEGGRIKDISEPDWRESGQR
jgi:hypothetical protein